MARWEGFNCQVDTIQNHQGRHPNKRVSRVGWCVRMSGGGILIKLGEVVGGHSLGGQSWTVERTTR